MNNLRIYIYIFVLFRKQSPKKKSHQYSQGNIAFGSKHSTLITFDLSYWSFPTFGNINILRSFTDKRTWMEWLRLVHLLVPLVAFSFLCELVPKNFIHIYTFFFNHQLLRIWLLILAWNIRTDKRGLFVFICQEKQVEIKHNGIPSRNFERKIFHPPSYFQNL